MTFKSMLATDLETFFNPDEFAETVIYTPVDGVEKEIIAVFVPGDGTPDSDFGKLFVKTSDIEKPVYQDTVVLENGEEWKVFRDKGQRAQMQINIWIIPVYKNERARFR